MEDFTRNIQRKKEKELEELQFVGGDGSTGAQPVVTRRQRRAATIPAPAAAARSTRSATGRRLHRDPAARWVFASSTLVWVRLDRVPPKWDDACYLSNSLTVYDALTHGGVVGYLTRLNSSFGFKAPLISALPAPFYLFCRSPLARRIPGQYRSRCCCSSGHYTGSRDVGGTRAPRCSRLPSPAPCRCCMAWQGGTWSSMF